jgi:hypothetical protein
MRYWVLKRNIGMLRRLSSLEGTFETAVKLIGSSESFGVVGPELLKLLGTSLQCNWGTLWKVDPAAHVLRPVATWSAPSIKAPELEKDTQGRALSLSEGTAGHVWRSRKPIWSVDLLSDMCLPRSLDAQHAGLQGGIWFPLKTETAVYGVFEFLGMSLPSPTEELLLGIESFGFKLGNQFEKHVLGARQY